MKWLIFVGLVLVSCLVIGKMITTAGQVDSVSLEQVTDLVQQSQVSAVMINSVPTPVSTATPYLSPTPDYLALAQGTRAALDNELAAARNTAEVAAITATAVVSEVRSTQAVILDNQATAQALGFATLTRAAEMTQASQVRAAATADIYRTATAMAPIMRRAEVAADWEPIRQLVYVIVILVIGFLLAWLLILIGRLSYDRYTAEIEYWKILGGEPQPEPTQPEPAKPAARDVLQDVKHNGGYVEVMEVELPENISMAKIAEVASAIMDDGTQFSRSGLVELGNILTDGQWDALRRWMSQRGYAKPVNARQANSAWYITPDGWVLLGDARERE